MKLSRELSRTCFLVITAWYFGARSIECGDHIPVERDPQYSEFQDLQKMFSATGTYYMKYRTYLNESLAKCISWTLVCTFGNGTILVRLAARFQGRTIGFDVPVSLTTVPGHNASNAMVHKTSPDDVNETLYFLMYFQPNQTCSVIRVPSFGNGCSLFVIERLADEDVPEECETIYRKNCPNITNLVYEPSCRNKTKKST
uniref:Putative lipocal-1 1 n=2 Tax=Ixodes ricinus TaxID=34613 RepID=V5GI30_IXORI